MNNLESIESQLDRVLAFFPRVDTKIAGLFTVNSTIMTIAALNVRAGDLGIWYITLSGLATLLLLGLSYYFLYQANFPDLKGGQGSVIYFAEIQRRTEVNYVDEYLGLSDADYRRDLLGQIWRNSEILCQKYRHVAYAVRLTLGALLPFTVFLVATAVEHTTVPVVAS